MYKEENLFNKIPDWLRYILAFPLSILGIIPIDIIIYISNLLYSDVNSIWFFISTFIIANFLNIWIFFYLLNYILPKHQFIITILLSSLFIVLFFIILGLAMYNETLDLENFIGMLLSVIACIFSCYNSYKLKIEQHRNLEEDYSINLPTIKDNAKLSKKYLKTLKLFIELDKLIGKINPYNNEEIKDYEDIQEYYKQYLNDVIDNR